MLVKLHASSWYSGTLLVWLPVRATTLSFLSYKKFISKGNSKNVNSKKGNSKNVNSKKGNSLSRSAIGQTLHDVLAAMYYKGQPHLQLLNCKGAYLRGTLPQRKTQLKWNLLTKNMTIHIHRGTRRCARVRLSRSVYTCTSCIVSRNERGLSADNVSKPQPHTSLSLLLSARLVLQHRQ